MDMMKAMNLEIWIWCSHGRGGTGLMDRRRRNRFGLGSFADSGATPCFLGLGRPVVAMEWLGSDTVDGDARQHRFFFFFSVMRRQGFWVMIMRQRSDGV
jgi:hypothetical protein